MFLWQRFCFRRVCFLWVGFSVATVQLVPYVSFSHQLHFTWGIEKWQRMPHWMTQNIHDCSYVTCVLVIRTLTLPVSLHSFHCQHPLSPGTELVCLPASSWFSDLYHHDRAKRGWTYCIKYTSCTDLDTAVQQQWKQKGSLCQMYFCPEIFIVLSLLDV